MKAGDLFDERFILVRCLGTGGMGSVWESRELPTARCVALKALHNHLAGDEEVVTRFLREGQAALESQLSAHVIEVLDVRRPEGRAPYLVMEYLDGQNLSQILAREGTLEPRRAVELVIQTCMALAEVHSRGIVHRDIKPENVFVTRLRDGSEWVKLLDFGVAKFSQPLDGVVSALTSAGCTLGTPNYMAPEQAEALGEVDHRVDVYATGAVLYELLTGERPFEAGDPIETMDLVALGNPVPPREIRPEISEPLEDVVLKAMSLDRSDRYQTMLELVEALEPFTGTWASSHLGSSQETTIRTEPLFTDGRPQGVSSSSAPTGRFLKPPPRTTRGSIPDTVVVRPTPLPIHERPTIIKQPLVRNERVSPNESPAPTESRRSGPRAP